MISTLETLEQLGTNQATKSKQCALMLVLNETDQVRVCEGRSGYLTVIDFIFKNNITEQPAVQLGNLQREL